MNKPTDQEFLNQLYEKLADPWASKLISMMGDKSLVDHAINSGAFTEVDRESLMLKQLNGEIQSEQ